MAKQTLPTNFVDDILAPSMGGKRKFTITDNGDGTYEIEDVTDYTQTGSDFGAGRINATNQAVNESCDKADVIDDLDDIVANQANGKIAGAKALATLNADLADSGWISLSPQVKYRKKAGIVTIVGDSSGDVSLPVYDSATTIGTLPEEFRPSIDVHAVGTPKNSSGYMMQIRVFPTGQVSLANLNPNYNLSFWGFSLSYPV